MDVLTFAQKAEYVKRLLHLSLSAKLDWAQISPHSFTVRLSKSFVELSSRDEDDRHPYLLQIFRTDGTPLVEVFSEDGPEPTKPDPRLEEVFHRELSMLYLDAKRRVLRIDEVASEVFADLDELDTS